MQIKVLANLPNGYRTELYGSFFEPGARYTKTLDPAEFTAPVPTRISPYAGSLLLAANIGEYKHYTTDEARRSAGAAPLLYARSAGLGKLTLLLDGAVPLPVFRQLMMGLMLAEYRFLQLKPSMAKKTGIAIELLAGDNAAAFKRELKRLEAINDGVCTARDLANLPGNLLIPYQLAEHAKKVAQQTGMVFNQLTGKQLAPYTGINAVGQGSTNPPVLFTLTYNPAKAKKGAAPLCLVGKGITFDSGGLSIKPWEGMWDMRADMGGAAAVIGAMEGIAKLGLPLPVTAVVAAAENMPDGHAYRPGDVLTYKNGRTVEIHSTDAEGRLVLADALIYAQETLKLRNIVELSTLTGACLRALGNQYIGLLSKSAQLKPVIQEAAASTGELVWELPLHPEYRLLLNSTIADMKNVGGALAGASTAGMFLHEFIQPGTEYVHLDIAPTFMADKEHKYWGQAGATGTGTRLCIVLAEALAGVDSPSC